MENIRWLSSVLRYNKCQPPQVQLTRHPSAKLSVHERSVARENNNCSGQDQVASLHLLPTTAIFNLGAVLSKMPTGNRTGKQAT